ELETTFEREQAISRGDVRFGSFPVHVPRRVDDKRGRAVRVVEKIVPATGSMFVMGRVIDGCITRPMGTLGALVGSRKGRAALLRATKRNVTIAVAFAGILLCPGIALAALAHRDPGAS